MNKYIKFDVIQYIREEKDRQTMREDLLRQYNDVPLLSSGMPSAVSSHQISHPTSEAATKRLAIKNKIDEIDHQSMVFSRSWDSLPDRQKLILSEFLYSDKSKSQAVHKLSKKLNMSHREVYRARGEALQALSQEILRQL